MWGRLPFWVGGSGIKGLGISCVPFFREIFLGTQVRALCPFFKTFFLGTQTPIRYRGYACTRALKNGRSSQLLPKYPPHLSVWLKHSNSRDVPYLRRRYSVDRAYIFRIECVYPPFKGCRRSFFPVFPGRRLL